MNIAFYKFSKRGNSTKLPTSSDQQTVLPNCELKDTTSIISPVLKIHGIPTSWNPIWNYCYIPTFDRYYFVNDWRWINGIWECSCNVDVLASWKTDIGNLSEYILRTNTTDESIFQSLITDTIYPVDNFIKEEYDPISLSPFVDDISSGGTYIVGIISSERGSVGAVTYYAMRNVDLENLKNILMSDANLQTMDIIDAAGNMLVQDMSKEVLKTMYNPFQYIVSCMWIPLHYSFLNTTITTTVKLGWWSYDVTCWRVNAQTVTVTEDFGYLPFHRQARSRGMYLNHEPYNRITLIGRFGTMAIDTSYIDYGIDQLKLVYTLDVIEGLCLVKVVTYHTTNNALTEIAITNRTFQMGVPIQLAQIGVDYLAASMATINQASGIFSGAISSVVGAAAGNAGSAVSGGMGMISSYANGIYNKINSTMPVMETSGTNGSFISPLQHTKMLVLEAIIAPEDITHKGRPVCQILTIDTLSGFIMCADGDIDIPCLDSERSLISQYLTSGFFWE